MANSLEELERELRTPLTLGSSPIPQPGLKIGPSQEDTAKFVWDMLLKINETAQKAPVMPGVTLGQAREDIIQPGMGQVALAKDYWRKKNKEIQEDTDVDSALQMFLADTGVDLFEMTPSTEAQLAFEAATELVPVAKLLAFIPPGLLKKLTKAIDVDEFAKVAKEIAEKSPPIKKLIALADGDVDVLKPLVLQARRQPHVRVHAGPVKFTGDEIDLRKAGGGSGGDLMGQGLYGTEKPKELTQVTQGYLDSLDFRKAQGNPEWPTFAREAKKQLIQEQDAAKTFVPEPGDINQRALQLWKDKYPDEVAALSEFTQPIGSIPYVTDQTKLTPVQAKAMYNAMPGVLRGMGLKDDAVERVMYRVHDPHARGPAGRLLNDAGSIRATDSDPDMFINSMNIALAEELGPTAMKGKAGRNLLNRLRMEIGYDELEYPSGQVFEAARGHRNYLMTRPETLRSIPPDEPLIGRRNYEGAERDELYNLFGDQASKKRALIDQADYWDRKARERGKEYHRFAMMHRHVGRAQPGFEMRVHESTLRDMGLDPKDFPESVLDDFIGADKYEGYHDWPVDYEALQRWGDKVGHKYDYGDPVFEWEAANNAIAEFKANWGEQGGIAKNALGRLIRGVDAPDRSALDAFEKSVDPIYKELRENALEVGDQESLTLYFEMVPLSIRNAWAKLEDVAGIERVGKTSDETFEQMLAKIRDTE